jgi:hypothetical protein
MSAVPECLGDFSDDDVLVRALRRGDADAFGWLLDHYSKPLLRVARTYVSNADAAHEVVQRRGQPSSRAWTASSNGPRSMRDPGASSTDEG